MRWSIRLGLCVLFVGCAEEREAPEIAIQTGGISFEEFVASVPVELDTGYYVVDGDVIIRDLEELRGYYELRIMQGALSAHTGGPRNTDVMIWDETQRLTLTYCVSTTFGARYSEVVAAMNAATTEWETPTGANFTHLPAQDGNCTPTNNNVFFHVEPVDSNNSYYGRAFYPGTTDRTDRRLRVDPDIFTHVAWTITGLLRHELGHVLGFHHEHARPQSNSCSSESNDYEAVTAYDSDSVMHYASCGGTNDGDLVITALDLEGARRAYGTGTSLVGVIPDASTCPSFTTEVRIDMDNEDHNEASDLDGWTGGTQLDSSGNITYVFCQVDGSQFRSLTTQSNSRANYAVLLLSGKCPAGSVRFNRHFDNEDDDPSNYSTGVIYPNVVNGNSRMHFCLFRGGAPTAASLPHLGFNYGVFAGEAFTFASPGGKGRIFSDDEDDNNNNTYVTYPPTASWTNEAQLIVSGGGNTTLRTARRGVPVCGDTFCNAMESAASCPADCAQQPPPPPPPPPGCGELQSRAGTMRLPECPPIYE